MKVLQVVRRQYPRWLPFRRLPIDGIAFVELFVKVLLLSGVAFKGLPNIERVLFCNVTLQVIFRATYEITLLAGKCNLLKCPEIVIGSASFLKSPIFHFSVRHGKLQWMSEITLNSLCKLKLCTNTETYQISAVWSKQGRPLIQGRKGRGK